MSLLYSFCSQMYLLMYSLHGDVCACVRAHEGVFISSFVCCWIRSGVLAPVSPPCPDAEKGLFVSHLSLGHCRDNECTLFKDGQGGRTEVRARKEIKAKESHGPPCCSFSEAVGGNADRPQAASYLPPGGTDWNGWEIVVTPGRVHSTNTPENICIYKITFVIPIGQTTGKIFQYCFWTLCLIGIMRFEKSHDQLAHISGISITQIMNTEIYSILASLCLPMLDDGMTLIRDQSLSKPYPVITVRLITTW